MIKQIGRLFLNLSNLIKKYKRTKKYNRNFNTKFYELLCGFKVTNSLFCFTCARFSENVSLRILDIKFISENN